MDSHSTGFLHLGRSMTLGSLRLGRLDDSTQFYTIDSRVLVQPTAATPADFVFVGRVWLEKSQVSAQGSFLPGSDPAEANFSVCIRRPEAEPFVTDHALWPTVVENLSSICTPLGGETVTTEPLDNEVIMLHQPILIVRIPILVSSAVH